MKISGHDVFDVQVKKPGGECPESPLAPTCIKEGSRLVVSCRVWCEVAYLYARIRISDKNPITVSVYSEWI